NVIHRADKGALVSRASLWPRNTVLIAQIGRKVTGADATLPWTPHGASAIGSRGCHHHWSAPVEFDSSLTPNLARPPLRFVGFSCCVICRVLEPPDYLLLNACALSTTSSFLPESALSWARPKKRSLSRAAVAINRL